MAADRIIIIIMIERNYRVNLKSKLVSCKHTHTHSLVCERASQTDRQKRDALPGQLASHDYGRVLWRFNLKLCRVLDEPSSSSMAAAAGTLSAEEGEREREECRAAVLVKDQETIGERPN